MASSLQKARCTAGQEFGISSCVLAGLAAIRRQERQEVGNDLLLCDVLRNVMPRYRGPDVRLFRGETAGNRRRRTYGIPWTDHPNIAESFATGLMQTAEGGTVVLETLAPRAAIIYKIHPRQDRYGEQEFLVDFSMPCLYGLAFLKSLGRHIGSEMYRRH